VNALAALAVKLFADHQTHGWVDATTPLDVRIIIHYTKLPVAFILNGSPDVVVLATLLGW
jgi:hypothetical protein